MVASEQKIPDSKTPDAEQPPVPEQPPVFGAVLADKGYDSDDLLKCTASLKAEAVIPSKKNRKVQRTLNRELYKDRNWLPITLHEPAERGKVVPPWPVHGLNDQTSIRCRPHARQPSPLSQNAC